MPPATKGKSKIKKENAERQKRILSSQEKILKIKRSILAIVETMLENNISKEWFLKNCVQLCHADYDDVVQERSIEHLCGYPLCSNAIKQTLKQKYHISRVTNKVYDLTERKNFCSNQCYKASNYLKAQLSPIPLYMRKEEKIQIHLLSDCDNRGSAGEEIVFHHIIPTEEIEKVFVEERGSNHFKNILNEEIKKCADSLSDLKIKERVFEKEYVFADSTAKQKEPAVEDNSESDLNNELDSDDSADEKLFTNYDNLSVSSDKHMPIPERSYKALLISPLNPKTPLESPVPQLSLEFTFNVFKDWMTEDAMKYLMGEKYVYGVKADHLFEKMTTSDSITPQKLSSIKDEYIKLCCKIDSLPDDDLSDPGEIDFMYACEETSTSKTEENAVKSSVKEEDVGGSNAVKVDVDIDVSNSEKVFKRRSKRNSKEGKKVTFASSVKSENSVSHFDNDLAEKQSISHVDPLSNGKEYSKCNVSCKKKSTSSFDTSKEENSSSKESNPLLGETEEISEETAAESSVPEPGFPLVDSVSQNAVRKQVLISKLKSVYIQLLPIIGLHYTDIREGVKKFVDRLSLTPSNIIFKPKEWKLISFILLRILTRTVLKELHDEDQLLKLCEDPILPIRVNLKELEKIVHDIISPENILTLPILLH